MKKKTPTRKKKTNFAFIDNENVNVSIKRMGRNIDRAKFRKRLEKDFDVEVAYLFM